MLDNHFVVESNHSHHRCHPDPTSTSHLDRSNVGCTRISDTSSAPKSNTNDKLRFVTQHQQEIGMLSPESAPQVPHSLFIIHGLTPRTENVVLPRGSFSIFP